MTKPLGLVFPCWLVVAALYTTDQANAQTVRPETAPGLRVGFGEADITPAVKATVFMAGFGHNRKATGIHDPLTARAVVLAHGRDKIALVSVDLVGLFLDSVDRVRQQLPGFHFVLVSSTHNHEGPDTLGLWGPNPFQSGLDLRYLRRVEAQIVQAVHDADKALAPATAVWGAARDGELLHDSRLPVVKHDELAVVGFKGEQGDKYAGLVIQWNCHPETLSSKNTQLSADFVAGTVAHLRERYECPVVYLTGTVGGLMTSLRVPIRGEDGSELADGTFAKTERYGRLVGQLAERALSKPEPVRLTPFRVVSRRLYLPIENPAYLLAWQLGVLQRKAFHWRGEVGRADEVKGRLPPKSPLAVETELAVLRLGEVGVAAIPGEIYPELVLGKVAEPAEAGADFPDAVVEPPVYRQLKTRHRMLVGLANDEIGYILPKRQWDARPPFCYGRSSAQYGEVNSLGPETGPLLCRAFVGLAKEVWGDR